MTLKTVKRLAVVFLMGTLAVGVHQRQVRAAMDGCADMGPDQDGQGELFDCGTCSDMWCDDGDAAFDCNVQCELLTGLQDGEIVACSTSPDTNCSVDCHCDYMVYD